MRFADLHLHTVFSDGIYTPFELLEKAKEAGLSCIAIVDHDSVTGVESLLEANQIKNDHDIEVLAGVELSCEYEGLEIHILGYLIDYAHKALRERLEYLRKNRIERIYKILDKLKGLGINLRSDSVFVQCSSQGSVGRLHVARAMLAEGSVNSVAEAFVRYIGEKSPAYVLGFKFSPQEAISLIKQTGGIPVLAHPYIVNKEDLISKLIDYGMMGLEVYYPEHTQAMMDFYLSLAKKYNLLVTGGSDYHGTAKPEVKIGLIKIPYDLVEKLKTAKEKSR